MRGELAYGLQTFSGDELATHRLPADIPADSSQELVRCAWPEADESLLNQCFFWARLEAGGRILSENRFFYAPLEGLAIPEARIEHSLEPAGNGDYRLRLHSDVYAWVVSLMTLPAVTVSDNYFDLRPGEQKAVIVHGPSALVSEIRVSATGKTAAGQP